MEYAIWGFSQEQPFKTCANTEPEAEWKTQVLVAVTGKAYNLLPYLELDLGLVTHAGAPLDLHHYLFEIKYVKGFSCVMISKHQQTEDTTIPAVNPTYLWCSGGGQNLYTW